MFPHPDLLLHSSEPPEGPTCLCSLGQNLPLGHLSEVGDMWELCYVVKPEMMTSDGLGSSLTDWGAWKSHLWALATGERRTGALGVKGRPKQGPVRLLEPLQELNGRVSCRARLWSHVVSRDSLQCWLLTSWGDVKKSTEKTGNEEVGLETAWWSLEIFLLRKKKAQLYSLSSAHPPSPATKPALGCLPLHLHLQLPQTSLLNRPV